MHPKRFFVLLILSVYGFLPALFAQSRGDLFVTVTDGTWNIAHPVQKGETIFMLARRYHVPPAILAEANGLSYQNGLRESSIISVPLGAYNLQTQKPANTAEARPLYYKAAPDDNLYRISRHAGVPQRTLVQWNSMPEAVVKPGQKLLVGWVLYDATQLNVSASTTTASPSTTAAPPRPTVTYITHPAVAAKQVDTPKYMLSAPSLAPTDTSIDVPGPAVATLQDLFKEQTLQEQNLVWEKGSAAFFSMTTQAKGASVFAFHNKAAKGSVIRVKNMNNGRIVFVKVLGPIPLTKQYFNCIIGLSGSAKAALGVKDAKAFCELSYAGY